MSCIIPIDVLDNTIISFKAFSESPNATKVITFAANPITNQTIQKKYLTTSKVYGVPSAAVSISPEYTGYYTTLSTPPVYAWKWLIGLMKTSNANSDVTFNIEVDYYYELFSRQAGHETPAP